nr:glutamate-5-semialdehyde dehydrogenase [Pseudomarimonas arenosa]
MRQQIERARAGLPALLELDAGARSTLISRMGESLVRDQAEILRANQADLQRAEAAGLSAAMVDRLRLDEDRLHGLAIALRLVAELPDPLRDDAELRIREDGLRLRQVRAPLGVIAMIYESRPNVTADAAALCLRAGNACVLRGGKEARESNLAIAASLQSVLRDAGLPSELISVLDDPDRSLLNELLRLDDLIDLVIPRGGEALIRFVAEHSRIPVIKHYKGVCHLYVDAEADLDQALSLLVDGKAQRPGVCNALECLLVDRAIAADFLPRVGQRMAELEVKIRASADALPWLPQAEPNDEWGVEYLDRVLAIRLVDGLNAALDHIAHYGSHHTEVICTRNADKAARFVRQVDASAVAVNASSRFNDGGELGLGAEIGISTTKLHAYGPMGLDSLTCRKWVIEGQGHIRHR